MGIFGICCINIYYIIKYPCQSKCVRISCFIYPLRPYCRRTIILYHPTYLSINRHRKSSFPFSSYDNTIYIIILYILFWQEIIIDVLFWRTEQWMICFWFESTYSFIFSSIRLFYHYFYFYFFEDCVKCLLSVQNIHANSTQRFKFCWTSKLSCVEWPYPEMLNLQRKV